MCAQPCDRVAWTSVHRASWCETCPALDHGHLTNSESLQQSMNWEGNCKGKQKELYLIPQMHTFLFVFTEGTKAACLKLKTSAPTCTFQSNSRWRCGSSRWTCRVPVTPCYSWHPQEVSQCSEQRRENKQGQVTQVQKEHKEQSCTNAALQARQLQVPGRVALKSLCKGTSNISSAVLLRLPGCRVWCFLQRARAVPEEGSRVPASTLNQPCFKLLAEAAGNARVCEGLPWGRVWRWQQCWLPSHTGSSPGTAPCNSLLTCECSVQGKQKAGWAWQENFSFPKHTVVGWSWLDARLPKPLCHSPSHLDRGEKI